MTSKDRKNSGRKITKIMHPETLPYEETKWDDWDDYRDSFRQLGRDKTKITPVSNLQKAYKYRAYKGTDVLEMNEKNKRQVKIRKARATARYTLVQNQKKKKGLEKTMENSSKPKVTQAKG